MAKLKPETKARKEREARQQLIKRLEKQIELMNPLVGVLPISPMDLQYHGTLDLIYEDLWRRLDQAKAEAAE